MPLLFFLFPITGLLSGLKYYFQKKYRFGLLFFFFFLGYTVFYTSGDVISYRDHFSQLIDYTWDDFFHLIRYFNNDDMKFYQIEKNVYNSKPDIYALSLGFLVSRFTENPRWFFAIVSVIYFYLMLKFLDEAVKLTGRVNTFGWKLFFIALVLIVPFYVGVTGVRFWTALFFYAWILLKYNNTGKKKFLFLLTLSILIHYTFIFPVIIAILSSVLNINKRFFRVLTILGILYALTATTTGSLNFISSSLQIFDNDTIENVSSSYLDEESLAERTKDVSETNWYVTLRLTAINVFFICFFILDYFNLLRLKKVKNSDFFNNLYQLFFLTALFTINLGSIARFIYVFYLLVIIRIISLQVMDTDNRLKRINYIFVPILILHFFVSFRSGFYYVDPLLLYAPSAAMFYLSSDVSLSQLIIGH